MVVNLLRWTSVTGAVRGAGARPNKLAYRRPTRLRGDDGRCHDAHSAQNRRGRGNGHHCDARRVHDRRGNLCLSRCLQCSTLRYIMIGRNRRRRRVSSRSRSGTRRSGRRPANSPGIGKAAPGIGSGESPLPGAGSCAHDPTPSARQRTVPPCHRAWAQRVLRRGRTKWTRRQADDLPCRVQDKQRQYTTSDTLSTAASNLEDVPSSVELRWRPGDVQAASSLL